MQLKTFLEVVSNYSLFEDKNTDTKVFNSFFYNNAYKAKLNTNNKFRVYFASYLIKQIKRNIKSLNYKYGNKFSIFNNFNMFELLQCLYTSNNEIYSYLADTHKLLLLLACLDFSNNSIDMELCFNLAKIKIKDIENLLNCIDDEKVLLTHHYIKNYKADNYINDLLFFETLTSTYDKTNKEQLLKTHLEYIKELKDNLKAEAEQLTDSEEEKQQFLQFETDYINNIDITFEHKNFVDTWISSKLNLLSENKEVYKDLNLTIEEAEKKLNNTCYQITCNFLKGGINKWYSSNTYKTQLLNIVSNGLVKLFTSFTSSTYYIEDSQNFITLDFYKNYYVINSWSDKTNNAFICFLENANLLNIFDNEKDKKYILDKIKDKISKSNIKRILKKEQDFYNNAIQCTNDAFFTMYHDNSNNFLYPTKEVQKIKKDNSEILFFRDKIKPIYDVIELSIHDIFCCYYFDTNFKNIDDSLLNFSDIANISKYKNNIYIYTLLTYILQFCNNDFIFEAEALQKDKNQRFKKFLQFFYYVYEARERSKAKYALWNYGASNGGKTTFMKFVLSYFNNDIVRNSLTKLIKDTLKNMANLQNKRVFFSDEETTRNLNNIDYANKYKELLGGELQTIELYYTSDKTHFYNSNCMVFNSNHFNFADIEKDSGVKERSTYFSFNGNVKNNKILFNEDIKIILEQKETKAYFLLLCILGGKLFADNGRKFFELDSDKQSIKNDLLDNDSVSIFLHDYVKTMYRLKNLSSTELWNLYNTALISFKLGKNNFRKTLEQKTKATFCDTTRNGKKGHFLRFNNDKDMTKCKEIYF